MRKKWILALITASLVTGFSVNHYVAEPVTKPPAEADLITEAEADLITETAADFITEAADGQKTNISPDLVNAEVTEISFRKNKYYDNYLFSYECEFTNKAEIGIMEIQYKITVPDQTGEILREYTLTYNGQDTPITPGSSIKIDGGGYFESGILPEDVGDAAVTVLKVISEEEMPPVHLPEKGEYLYQAMHEPHLENIREEHPVEILAWIDHGGPRDVADITDPDTIDKAVDAFTKIRIGEETNEWVTDNYNGISMTFEDGTQIGISINLANLETSYYGVFHIYELDDFGEFWGMMAGLAAPEKGWEEHDDA